MRSHEMITNGKILSSTSLNWFFKEMFRDQSEKFVNGHRVTSIYFLLTISVHH